MLNSIDILIGLSVVMLVVSLAVTLVNQAILNLFASRGQNLLDGLADLLELLGAGMTRNQAKAIAKRTLSYPTIGGKIWSWLPLWVPSWLPRVVQFFKYGDVIHREEFIKILLGLAASEDGKIKVALENLKMEVNNNTHNITQAIEKLEEKLKENPVLMSLDIANLIDKVKRAKDINAKKQECEKLENVISCQTAPLEKLKKALQDNGIEDPAATLKNVRMLALQYEKSHPELANDIRQANALLQEASSEFLAKIHLNFDQVMDRVSVRFTSTTRVVSFLGAALVAIVLQLDTVYVINRLAMDDQMRAAFVELSPKLTANQEVKSIVQTLTLAKAPQSVPQGTGNKDEVQANTTAEADNANEGAKLETEKYYLKFLADQGLINIATSYREWRDNWKSVSIPGLFLSIFLLSLGAPFWYNALGKLLQLRSVLAQKDDEQKKIRQTTQAGGDGGDLNADG
jgi:hypothetical protein